MMIAILAGVPFMGFVGFILGPVLMPLFLDYYYLQLMMGKSLPSTRSS